MTNRPAKKMKPVVIGSLVAFNELPDATWFEVLSIDGFQLTIREYNEHSGKNYREQYTDKSLVRQVK